MTLQRASNAPKAATAAATPTVPGAFQTARATSASSVGCGSGIFEVADDRRDVNEVVFWL